MGGLSLETTTLGLGVVLVATILVALAARIWLRGGGEAFPGNLTLYQVAYLAGGPTRVSDTALSYLVCSGIVEVRERNKKLVRVVGPGAVPDLHPIERAVLSVIDPVGVPPDLAMGTGRKAARHHVIEPPGLLVLSGRRFWADLVVVGGSGLGAGAALWWLLASDTTKLGFVPLLAVFSVVLGGWWITVGRPRLSAVGMETLELWRERFDPDIQIAAIGVTSLPLERAMSVVALYGRDVLTGGLSALRTIMTGSPASMTTARSLTSR